MDQWELDRDELGGLASVRGGAWLRYADGQLGLLDLTADAAKGRTSLLERGLLSDEDGSWRVRDTRLESALDLLTRCSANVSVVMGRTLRVSHGIACSGRDALMVETTAGDASHFKLSSCEGTMAAARLLELITLADWESKWSPGPWRGFEAIFTLPQLDLLFEAEGLRDPAKIRSAVDEVSGESDAATALWIDINSGLEAFELRIQDYVHVGGGSILRWNRSRLGGFWRVEPNIETGEVTVVGSDGHDVGSRVQLLLDRIIR